MDKQEHLNRIRAKCLANIALAEKRTPGKWKAESAEIDWSKVTGPDGHSLAMCHPSIADRAKGKLKGDSAFIAACAGPAEAGWRSTLAAIEQIQTMRQDTTSWDFIGRPLTDSILAAWPEELLS